MTINVAQLVAPTQLTGTVAVYFTCPANTTARIDRAIFSNPTGGALTITAYLVPSAGSPTTANQVINAQSIGAGAVYVSPELSGQVLLAGGTLQAFASAATSIVLSASGLTIN
jgi:hypothetical protein